MSSRPRPLGARPSLWLAALAALFVVAGQAAADSRFAPLRLSRPADRAASARPDSGVLDRLRALHRVAQSGRVTRDAFMRPRAKLGILARHGDRWVPARGAPDRRAEILRTGDLEALGLGELGRTAALAAQPDTVRMLVLRIDFLTDRAGSATTGDGRFDVSTPDSLTAPPVDPPPHNRAFYETHMEALRRYLEAEFHGRLVLQWDIYPHADSAYHCNDMDDFGPWKVSLDIFPIAYKMFQTFIAAADTQDATIPWSQFDRVMIVHAGSDLQSDTRLDSDKDIPTFTIGLDDSLAIPVHDEVADSTFRIFAAAILPETVNQDGNFAALNAVIAHENGHNIFGWRDVYDVFSGFPVCGFWTLMDTGNLLGSTVRGSGGRTFFAIGMLPPAADPYQRHLAYDDLPSEVTLPWSTSDSLRSPFVEAKAFKVPISSEEYVLLENRQGDLNGDGQIVLVRDTTTGVIVGPSAPDSLEYDFLLPGYGILAWHVDESVVAFDPPGRRSDGFYTLNGNPDRHGLFILEGDGLQDLGDFTSPYPLGSPLDPLFIGNGTRLSPTSRPPLLTNSGTNPHVTIDVQDSVRLSMSVRVARDWALAGWPVKARAPVGGIEPLVLTFNGVGRRVVFAAGDSAIHAVLPDGTGGVLWKAPAPLSPVAELDHPTLGPLAVAVYPDPAQINDSTWSTNGSWIVAVTGAGVPAPGFPMQLTGPAWITAGPVIAPASASNGNLPHIVVGERTGGLAFVTPSGVQDVLTACSSTVAGGTLAPGAIEALAVCQPAAGGRNAYAYADSNGSVSVALEGPCPAVFPDLPTPPARGFRVGWHPILTWAELETGASGTQTGTPAAFPDLVALDRDRGEGAIFGAGKTIDVRGLDTPLTKGVAVGDMDGDGFNEVVIATQDGRVGFWNLSGSATPGWPKDVDPEPFASFASPVLAGVDAESGPDIVMATGSGRILALDRSRHIVSGWPLGTGAGQQGSASLLDVDGDANLEVVVGDADSLLYAFAPLGAPASGAVWPVWGGGPGRTFANLTVPATGSLGGSGVLVEGTLKCYPNPARRSPLTIAFQLTEPGSATLTVFDPTGREVARLTQPALQSDNALVWNPSDRAPGLYLGRLEVAGQSGRRETRLVQLGVLH